jgi:hypothetical protein
LMHWVRQHWWIWSVDERRKIAKSVLEFFDNEENKIIIARLKITEYNLKL